MFKKIVALSTLVCMMFSINAFADNTNKTIESILTEQAIDFVVDNYKYDVEETELYQQAMEAVLAQHPELIDTVLEAVMSELDDYSYYINADEYQNFVSSIVGVFVGIGVNINEIDGYVTVISPINGSPAHKAGIIAGDKFVSVNGEDVVGKGIEYIQGLILGKEGTDVTVGVLRDGETLEFTITRAPIEQSSVASYVLPDNKEIGYIQIAEFSSTTAKAVKESLLKFDSMGVKKLIIDLRDNPGGEEKALIQTLQMFMPAGEILHIEYKDSARNETFYSYNKSKSKYDIAILVNENSASAAEAFAGSMKDKKVATIVGMTTYGKGTVQTITPTILGSGLRLTVATYTTAGKTQINKKGVEPDIMIENKTVPFEENPEAIPMKFEVVINENSAPEAIEAVQQRLMVLGYYQGEIDGVYNNALKAAIKTYQGSLGTKQTGVMDIMTQIELNNNTRLLDTVIDVQLETAIEVLK